MVNLREPTRQKLRKQQQLQNLLARQVMFLILKLIKRMMSKDLVDGMVLGSDAKPDPICEPCLAGKQNGVAERANRLFAERIVALLKIWIVQEVLGRVFGCTCSCVKCLSYICIGW